MRVLLCRARQDSEATMRKLIAAGHSGLLAPVIEIVALDPDLTAARGIDALLMTSAHAATMLRESDAIRWAGCPLYAVGRRTAAAARRRGFREVRIGDGDAAALLDLLALTLPAPAHLLYLAGHLRKANLEEGLQRSGYRLSVAEVYDAREAAGWDDSVHDALMQGSIQACLHFSRRSAELALGFAAKGRIAAAFAELRHVCISQDAASPLFEAGIASLSVASQPSEDSMLNRLQEN
jgi:uroporphyrinogen-III synthase